MFRESTADVLRWVFIYTITAALNRHIQNWKTDLFTNLSNRFLFQAFPKTRCLISITPSHIDCPYLILSFYHAFLYRHQQGWQSRCAQAHMCRHTHRRYTCTHTRRGYTCVHTHTEDADAQTFPTATSKVMHAHPASDRHTEHPPGRAE